jgi:hypothetical protein
MATPAQIEANRRNGLKSTGPRTAAGKACAARNATRHGIFSRHLVMKGEDGAAFDAFHDGLYARLRPGDALERLYVERIIAAAWRMQRALSAEADLLTSFNGFVGQRALQPDEMMHHDRTGERVARLQKYYATLERGMDKATAELLRLQDRRAEAGNEENEANFGEGAVPAAPAAPVKSAESAKSANVAEATDATPSAARADSPLPDSPSGETKPMVEEEVLKRVDGENEANRSEGEVHPAPAPELHCNPARERVRAPVQPDWRTT